MVGTIVITIKKSKQNSISNDNSLLGNDKSLIAASHKIFNKFNLLKIKSRLQPRWG
jgi:hypothetical protein